MTRHTQVKNPSYSISFKVEVIVGFSKGLEAPVPRVQAIHKFHASLSTLTDLRAPRF